jgi:hypothetical protein
MTTIEILRAAAESPSLDDAARAAFASIAAELEAEQLAATLPVIVTGVGADAAPEES